MEISHYREIEDIVQEREVPQCTSQKTDDVKLVQHISFELMGVLQDEMRELYRRPR